MLLRDLVTVYISRNTPQNNYGEYTASWSSVGTAYLNIQQDLDELDRNTSGLTDYGIWKARTTCTYDIRKGDGISLTPPVVTVVNNVTTAEPIIPEYRVLDIQKIGKTTVYRMEAYNGD